MTPQTLAWIYAALTALPFMMQIGLTLGAPWGRFTMGGQWPGQLPLRLRPAAAFQALLLALMALAILSAASALSLGWPQWTAWVALAMTALTCIANWITPSRPERLLWGPIITLMLIAASFVVFGWV